MKRALVDNQNIDERKRRKKVKRIGIFCYIKDHNIEKALSLKMNRVSVDVQNIYSRKRKMEQQNIDEELSLKMMRTSLDDRNVDGRNEKKMKMGKNDGDGDDVVCESERQTQQQKHYFPDDLVFELLLRLPIKDLHRFRCVSKDWGSIIFSPPFLEAYWRRLCYPSLLQVNELEPELGDVKPKENIFV